MKRIAIIPARGGSKRLKNKNILKIEGIPLIGYTIIAAQKWGKFDEIFVNSEDKLINTCAQEYGAIPYLRPVKLAGDNDKVIDVIKDQILSMKLMPSTEIAILLPTCPLRTSEDIENSYKLFTKHNFHHSVVSMSEYEKAPEQEFYINEDGILKPKFQKKYSSRSQDHIKHYRYNTAIIYTTVSLFLDQEDIVGMNSIPYVMPYDRSIDIDYDHHIKMVELILSKRKN